MRCLQSIPCMTRWKGISAIRIWRRFPQTARCCQYGCVAQKGYAYIGTSQKAGHKVYLVSAGNSRRKNARNIKFIIRLVSNALQHITQLLKCYIHSFQIKFYTLQEYIICLTIITKEKPIIDSHIFIKNGMTHPQKYF